MADGQTNLDRLDAFGRCQVFAADPHEAIATQQALLHPDFEILEAPSLPYAGSFRGPQGWADLLEKVKAAWSPVRVTPLWTIGEPDGDRFAKMYRVSGTSPKTGRSFDTQVFELWEFTDGKIRRCVPFYFDTHALHDVNDG